MAGTLTGAIIAHRSRGIVKITATLLTDAAGVVTAAVAGQAFGKLLSVEYKPGTLATGADITVTDFVTGAPILTLTDAGVTNRKFRPTTVVTDNVGVAVTAATTATDVNRDIYIAGKIAVAVAQGGNALTGSISFIVDEGPTL